MPVAAPPTVTGVSNGQIQLSNGTIAAADGTAPAGQKGVAYPATRLGDANDITHGQVPGMGDRPATLSPNGDYFTDNSPVGAKPAKTVTDKPPSSAVTDYWNEMAAIAGPETLPGVDMSQYIGAYNQAYNTQMANIKAGLQQSLGQVQVRRDQAAGIVAKMPGQLDTNYGTVANDEAAQNADVTAGLTGRAAQDVAGAQVRGADVLQENRQAQKDTTPYMQLGITANQQADEAALNASANNAEAGAEAQRAQAEEAMYMQQAQAATSYAQSRQDRIAQFTASQIAQNNATKLANETQPARNPALAAQGFTQGQVDKAMADPAYKWFENQIVNHTDQKTKDYLLWMTKQPGNEVLGPLVIAQNPDYFKGANTATGSKSFDWGLPHSIADWASRPTPLPGPNWKI
jgi:hypothetical protein